MSENWSFRPASEQDVDAIRLLVRAAYAKWVPVIGREPLPMAADYAKAVQQHRIDLLYGADGLAALIELVPGLDHMLIENVAVLPDFQKRGLGRKLLDHAEDVARQLGLAEIKLYTNKLFAENIELYQKLGYQIDREETWAKGVTIHMNKHLSG